MNIAEDLRATVQRGLEVDADAVVGRDGLSLFDHARQAVREAARIDPETVFAIISEIAAERSGERTEWWLTFLDLLEEMQPISKRNKLELGNLFVSSPPKNVEAAAYLLR